MTGARPYLVGLALALVLTAIPFAMVHFRLLAGDAAIAAIVAAAVLQIGVHLRLFLRLGLAETPRANLLALGFAALLILLMVGGSLWIMSDLHARMLP